MNILEALREPIFSLPKQNEKPLFSDLLQELYTTFLGVIDKIDNGSIVSLISSNRAKLQSLCEGLVQSTNTYYQGYPAKAYFQFEETIKEITDFIIPSKRGIVVSSKDAPFYRARTGGNHQFKRDEMFHIPFEKREYVTTQRFSVPGLPCLYLSNSTYVCWEELRRPDINKMQVSRMKLEDYRLNFLDLSLTPAYLATLLEATTTPRPSNPNPLTLDSWDNMSMMAIMRWPLVAACSIKVRRQDGSFKPEYIFPQFLLQWVTQIQNIAGIKYFSVEANILGLAENSQWINYAIPVKETKSEGLCKALTESFSLTQPISWEMLNIVNPNIAQHDKDKFDTAINSLGLDNLLAQFEFVKGSKMPYLNSIFGKLEIEMANMETQKITTS
jgi:hypothetical protein